MRLIAQHIPSPYKTIYYLFLVVKTRSFYERQNSKDIKLGQTVDIVLKQDQRSGKFTRGMIRDILTNSAYHPHGIRVRLQSGQVGRVQRIIE
ncbi:MAG: YwbE family protein [Methanotrichaceae archaeon]|nr:YwbE family protein [Methanotrichaceae archaeon]